MVRGRGGGGGKKLGSGRELGSGALLKIGPAYAEGTTAAALLERRRRWGVRVVVALALTTALMPNELQKSEKKK